MKLSYHLLIAALVVCAYTSQTVFAQGVLLRGIGATNAAVGGTATAMPIDAAGALQWNPGSISALKKNEMTFGLEILQPKTTVTTSGHADNSLNGTTKGNAGEIPAPNMAFVWSTSRRSPFTYGLGMSAVGGAASLYPQDSGNLVLAEHGQSANVIVLQVTPTVSTQLTERLSVGVAPIVDLASLNINPMSLGRPLGQPLDTYGTKYAWGMGFQIGALYDFQNHFKAGFMFKSPVWAEKLYFTGTSVSAPTAGRQDIKFDLNLPMTLSAGISYDGLKDTIIGIDVRYFDYANTAGLDKGINFASGGIVEGLDWNSVYSVNVGMERKINHRLKARLGYAWNEAPIPGRSSALCVSAPMITQHVFSCGFGYTFAKDLELSAAYSHAVYATLSGPHPLSGLHPAYQNTTITNTLYGNSLFAGITKRW